MHDPIMLLRVLRQWHRTNGNDPQDDAARVHPLYPGNNCKGGCSDSRRLWAAVDDLIGTVPGQLEDDVARLRQEVSDLTAELTRHGIARTTYKRRR